MRPDYPIGLPVLWSFHPEDARVPGVLLIVDAALYRVAWDDEGCFYVEHGVPRDCVEPDLSQPLARSWAREEVARRVGLDPASGVYFRREWAGWSVRVTQEGTILLTEEPPFGGWRREVVGIDTPDEATALAACLRALPPVTL